MFMSALTLRDAFDIFLLMENELEKEKKQYELAVLLDNESAESVVADFLTKNQAEIYQKDGPKTIDLAYSIKKHTTAFLAVYYFYSLPSHIRPIDSELRLQPHILRFLLITPPIKKLQKTPRTDNESKVSSPVEVDISPPKAESVSNETLEEALEKILQQT